jgi:hypothetical protein
MLLATAANISASTYNLLTWSGWAIVVVCMLAVIVPYWRGKSDLLTAWNFALVGMAIFLGVAALEAVDPPKRIFEEKMSFEFPDDYYVATLVRNIFFLACALFFYYVFPLGKKFASRRFVNSPPWSPLAFGTLLAICGGVAAVSIILSRGEAGFLNKSFLNLGQKAVTFGVAFAFYAWYRNRFSPISLVILLAVVAVATVYAMGVSHGRRLLLCIAFAPMAVAYWTNWRYKRPVRVLLVGGVGLVCVLTIGLWYQTFRFFDRGKQAQERTFANALQAASQVDVEAMLQQVGEWKWRLAQGAYLYSNVVKRLVDTGVLDEEPLYTFQYLVTYPIPRRYWEDKPFPLGARIVTDVLNLPYNTNWGLGVAGQAYYEGDWYALVAYAALFVILVRLIDEPLKREPNNPYLIAALASASLYVVAWPRGDLGVQGTEILECFLFLLAMQWAGALLTGAKRGAYALDFGSVFTAQRKYLPH